MIKACVIGMPIAHSRSPKIHAYWLSQLGIDGAYERIQVEPPNLREFLESLKARGYQGCNITIPHKEAAARIVKHLDARAQRIGSINTVWIHEDELHATSTDGVGFCNNLESSVPNFPWPDTHVVILGAGGSAVAITDEVLRRGAKKIVICNRTIERAETMAARFSANIIASDIADAEHHFSTCALLINATSLGLAGREPLNIKLDRLPSSAVVADINYVPLRTDLIKSAEKRNLRTVGGLGMLLHQAVPGFERWFGKRPTVTKELHDLIARDIEAEFKS